MTRFKELKRIESAIENKDEKEILWAIAYCKSRLSITKLKSQVKYWKNMINQLENLIS